jgi:small neutral amino acid transporter SnatA (MarC family)
LYLQFGAIDILLVKKSKCQVGSCELILASRFCSTSNLNGEPLTWQIAIETMTILGGLLLFLFGDEMVWQLSGALFTVVIAARIDIEILFLMLPR